MQPHSASIGRDPALIVTLPTDPLLPARMYWSALLQTEAIILDAPGALRLATLDLKDPTPQDAVIEMRWSGISTGTEKLFWTGEMPWFPGFGYPLVPGYEGVGTVVEAGRETNLKVGANVLVPGANCYKDAYGLFGASSARVVVPGARLTVVEGELNEQVALFSLAATAQHALAASPNLVGDLGRTLIVGHGIVGRLLARLMIARGDAPPIVFETNPARVDGAQGYEVCHPDNAPKDARPFTTIFDASGDPAILDQLISRLGRGGEIVLAGFYAKPLQFAFPPAFMREVRLRIAAEWQPSDMVTVSSLVEQDRLSLDGLITHRRPAASAPDAYATAFADAACLKMILDWSAKA